MENVSNPQMGKVDEDLELMRRAFSPNEWVVYRKKHDPIYKIAETANLVELYEWALQKISKVGGLHGFPNPWKFRNTLSGYYDFNPFPNWEGRTVECSEIYRPGLKSGKVVASRVIGKYYLVGVEFPINVPGGHSLGTKTHGNLGREGCCRWYFLDQVEFLD